MESEFRCLFTRKAEADLDDIVGYMVEELRNTSAAANFINRLQKVLDGLLIFPESGQAVMNDFVPDVGVRKKVVENYIIFYLFDPDEKIITVLRIVYSRRNMDEILSKLNV